MKKILAVTLLSLAAAAPAFAGDSPVYAGVSFGSSTLPSSGSATSLGFLGGYKLDKSMTPAFMNNVGGTLAIEGQYTMLGEEKTSFSTFGGTFTTTAKYSSIGADVVALFPIKSVEHLSAFGKLGFASTSSSATCSGTGAYAAYACSATANASGLVWGAGAQYDVDRSVSVRAGYQTYASNVTTLYAAALYNF